MFNYLFAFQVQEIQSLLKGTNPKFIAIYQQAVVLKLMPMNNATGITDAERALIGRWFEAGAPTAP